MAGEPHRLRAVFDCMVFLQGAARKDSPAGICLRLVETGLVDLFLSDDVIDEIRNVLKRPRLRQKFPVLTDEFVDQFLAALLARSSPAHDVPRVFAYERDPKDEPYINLALAVHAEYLVSRDIDILDLGDTSNPEGQHFQERFPQVKIVDPVTFLREVQRREK
jgi:putative PIN family toxin of toxin-antitoxin system